MAYTSGFEHDIFISYCHLDNTVPQGEKGWVDQFHEWLQSKLVTKLGDNKIKIWRDTELLGSTLFDEKILNVIRNSALFFALTSPNYFKSEYCKKELFEFYKYSTSSSHGLSIGYEKRIFHILLHNIHHSKWPEELAGTSGFPMFDVPERSDKLGEPYSPKNDIFQEQLRKIIDAVQNSLDSFHETKIEIFIADVSDSLRNKRDRLEKDLTKPQVKIGPEIPPPWYNKEHEKAVMQAILTAQFSLHLLDEVAGRKITDNKIKTYPQRQLEIALELTTPGIAWIPKHIDIDNLEDKNYTVFLKNLENEPSKKINFEFIRSDYTEFVQYFTQKISQIIAHGSTIRNTKTILLHCHKKDQLFAFEIALFLSSKGFEIDFNQEFNDPGKSMDGFVQELERSQHLIILFGQVTIDWVLQRMQKIRQLIASENEKIMIECCWIYLIPPAKDKTAFPPFPKILKIQFIDNSESLTFGPDKLRPLLDYCSKGNS